jgi:hypothetical protein
MPKVISKPPTNSEYARYTRAASPVRQRIIALSAGEPGSRKTSFWLEAPGPIVVFSMDRGLDGVIQRYQDQKDIYVKEYPWFPVGDDVVQRANDVRAEFIEDYEHAIQQTNTRTIVLDKGDDFWSLYRMAEGLTGGDAQKDYAVVNAKMRHLLNLAKESDINLGIIAGLKDKWGPVVNKRTGQVGSGPTGERVPAGFKEMEGLVHMVLIHSGLSPATWQMSVGKVRGPGSMDLAEQTFPYDLGNGETMTFSAFGQMVFPDSTEESWR